MTTMRAGSLDASEVFTREELSCIYEQSAIKRSASYNHDPTRQVVLVNKPDLAELMAVHDTFRVWDMPVIHSPALLVAWGMKQTSPFVAPTVYPIKLVQKVMDMYWTSDFYFHGPEDWQYEADRGLHSFHRDLRDLGIVHEIQDSEISFVQRPAKQGQARIEMRWSPGGALGTDLWTTLADGSAGYAMTSLSTRAVLQNPAACDVWGWNWLVGGWAAPPTSVMIPSQALRNTLALQRFNVTPSKTYGSGTSSQINLTADSKE